MSQDTRAYLGEFIGTFTLVFIGTAVATLTGVHKESWGDTGLLAISMAFGFTLMVLVWVIGPVSGCHVNPAVSIPMALAGRMRASLLPGYLVAQFLGGFLASLVLWGLVSGMPNYNPVDHGLGANWNARNMNLASLFGIELVLSSLFIMVIFSTTRRDALRGFEAWAIGGFLFVAHLVAAQLGDASLNPARSLGPALVEAMCKDAGALAIVWLFIVAPVFGGLIGWQLFKLIHSE
jgi:aquaporin Z